MKQGQTDFKQIGSDVDRNNDIGYEQNIVDWLKKREKEMLEYKRQSPQISKRRPLIDWTTMVAEKLQLSNCTVHLAVKMLDYFMDGHDIQNPQLYLVCLVSLLLAAKMEEKDAKIPKCSEMNVFAKNQFPLTDFFSLEIVMLKYFNWNLLFPTACNFTEIWLPHAIHPTDLHNKGPLVSFREARSYFQQYVKYFLDLAMQEASFIEVRPSLLGASLIAAARIAFGLTPTWSQRMICMTGYSMDSLRSYTIILLASFKLDAVEENEDEGYGSLMGSPDKQMDLSCQEEMMET